MEVLFVCMGNICRSPLAEAILRRKAKDRAVSVEVDSAGTGDWHAGEWADHRARQVGEAAGYRMDLVARQVRVSDFERFDLILAMDHQNLRDLRKFPGYDPTKVRLARSFDPRAEGEEVPDPYYGGANGFVNVLQMLEKAVDGLLDEIEARPSH